MNYLDETVPTTELSLLLLEVPLRRIIGSLNVAVTATAIADRDPSVADDAFFDTLLPPAGGCKGSCVWGNFSHPNSTNVSASTSSFCNGIGNLCTNINNAILELNLCKPTIRSAGATPENSNFSVRGSRPSVGAPPWVVSTPTLPTQPADWRVFHSLRKSHSDRHGLRAT